MRYMIRRDTYSLPSMRFPSRVEEGDSAGEDDPSSRDETRKYFTRQYSHQKELRKKMKQPLLKK